jgi:hypothetical protein
MQLLAQAILHENLSHALLPKSSDSTILSLVRACEGHESEEKEMKTVFSKCIAAAAIALIATGIRAQADSGCSDQTLSGSYAFRVSGEVFVPNSNTIAAYRDGIAMTTFDGNGGLTQVDWVVANGSVVSGPTNQYGFHDGETGSYSVNPDCTGEAEIDFPVPPHGISGAVIKLMLVIGDEGRTLHTIVSSLKPPNSTAPVPANIHSDAVRVSPF